MSPAALLESALYVDDLDEAETFYGGVLGLARITRAEGRHVFFRCREGVLLLFVLSKELRKSEEAAAMKSRMASFQDQRARQDYFRAWFEKARENANMKLETIQQLAMSESR